LLIADSSRAPVGRYFYVAIAERARAAGKGKKEWRAQRYYDAYAVAICRAWC